MPTSRTTRASKPKPRHPSETRAAWWYRLHGYRILDGNVWLAGGELDLVVRRGRVIAFCEVKSKAGDGHGDPLEMIPPVKIGRIRRAAEAWLAQHPELERLEVRFDVVAVRGTRVEHLPEAF